ncbi:MAG: hypothetical protein ACREVW_02260 [Burkholderiales bacterium]
MATIAELTFSATIGTTEYSIPNASTTLTPITTDGPVDVFLDCNAVAGGDEFAVKIYEKAKSGDTQRLVERWTIAGPQGTPIWSVSLPILLHGWDVTITKIAGTDRAMSGGTRQIQP